MSNATGKQDVMHGLKHVQLTGIAPIMFDRYAGNNVQLSPMDKAHYNGEALVLPALNFISFLSSEGTECAPKRVCGKMWKTTAHACLSYVTVLPDYIQFSRNGVPLTKDNHNMTVAYHCARVKKAGLSIPNPKERPLLALPWELNFDLKLADNNEIDLSTLHKIIVEGGLSIGLGTFRHFFGKFNVTKWE